MLNNEEMRINHQQAFLKVYTKEMEKVPQKVIDQNKHEKELIKSYAEERIEEIE